MGRAVLPADSFASGPTSGWLIEPGVSCILPPFIHKQPIQGFSAILKGEHGFFYTMPDNGFGNKENSRDYSLRVYKIRPDFKTSEGGSGKIEVEGYFELKDPLGLTLFPIVNEWTSERILTGADFDLESMQKTPDGTFWFGDEFGPFLLHTDKNGTLLDPPVSLPDFSGGMTKSPQNPLNEVFLAVMDAIKKGRK